MAGPYRTPGARDDEADVRPCPSCDLAVMTLVFWLASLARVVSAFFRREIFGVEATLATFAVVLCPILSRSTIAWVARRVLRVICKR